MQRPKLHMAEDLLIRFRSKEDLFGYMSQQDNLLGHVALEVLLGPEAAEEVLSHVQLGPLQGCVEI